MPSPSDRPSGPTVLTSGAPSGADVAVAKLAEFLGLTPTNVEVAAGEPPPAADGMLRRNRMLVLSGATLDRLHRADWFAQLIDEVPFVLVHGFSPSGDGAAALPWLTDGAVHAAVAIPAGRREVVVAGSDGPPAFPVCGRRFTEDGGATVGFAPAATDPRADCWIRVAGHPYFLGLRRRSTQVFLLADPAPVDLDTPLAPDATLQPWYAPLIAQAIALRTAFGAACWTAPATVATFIVDDPSLQPRYGFIEYTALLAALRRTGSALTIAFIPYNHRRSDGATVASLQRAADRFSIAIHGCDHTAGEFASRDPQWLADTVATARQRMERHAREAGMTYDNIMVFPQGRFSAAAMTALRQGGVAAAVNTRPWPVDGHENPLTIRDLLSVASTRYGGLPLFVRHYPPAAFDLAFAAFFQKPVLVVEHHGFFRDGYADYARCVEELAPFAPPHAWHPLGESLRTACLLRQTGPGEFALRHFLPELAYRNTTGARQILHCEKPEPAGAVAAVQVGARSVPFTVQDGFLRYDTELDAGAELRVVVSHARPGADPTGETAPPRRARTLRYRLRVTARRLLSDFRDNHLARSRLLLAAVETIRGGLRRRTAKPAAPPRRS